MMRFSKNSRALLKICKRRARTASARTSGWARQRLQKQGKGCGAAPRARQAPGLSRAVLPAAKPLPAQPRPATAPEDRDPIPPASHPPGSVPTAPRGPPRPAQGGCGVPGAPAQAAWGLGAGVSIRLRVEGRRPDHPEWTGLGPDRPLFPAPPCLPPIEPWTPAAPGPGLLVPPLGASGPGPSGRGLSQATRSVRGTFLGHL